ncbi:hypothetical protein H5410_037757, partial [Solanum commersonii]
SQSAHSSRSESPQATGSNAKSSTGSGENDQAASSKKATSSESIPAPPNNIPTPVAGEPNRWCVEGQWQIYRDAKMERRVLTGSLHTVPDIHRLFNLHKCDWMARDPGTYSEEIVWEFYASYAATLRGSISKRRFLYGPTAGHSWSLNTAEFDYRWDIVRSDAFQRNSEQREAVIHWLAKYIAADGERAEWVAAPRLGIRKATLTFMAKFFWLLVRNRVSPTKADNQVTWDRAVMVAALVAGVEIDFARIFARYTRGIQTSTTYPFPCLIFRLCEDCECRPHWTASPPYSTLDIGLIRDEANAAGDDLSALDHTNTIPGSSSQAASMGRSSSRSTPQLGVVVVPLARPWMQKSITESEARVERRMEDMMDRKVQAINNRLDAFELRVLERPAPAIDLSALQDNIASLRSDVEAILVAPSVEPQVAPTALADDTLLDALFKSIDPETTTTYLKPCGKESASLLNLQWRYSPLSSSIP